MLWLIPRQAQSFVAEASVALRQQQTESAGQFFSIACFHFCAGRRGRPMLHLFRSSLPPTVPVCCTYYVAATACFGLFNIALHYPQLVTNSEVFAAVCAWNARSDIACSFSAMLLVCKIGAWQTSVTNATIPTAHAISFVATVACEEKIAGDLR